MLDSKNTRAAAKLPPNPNIDAIIEEVAAKHSAAAKQSNIWRSKDRPGLNFRLLKMARMVLVDAGNLIKDPEPPTTFIEEKQRSEPNILDPTYRAALREAQYQRSVTYINTTLALGTALQDAPDDISLLDDDDWVERVAVAGLTVPTGKYNRYVAWVRWYLLGEDELTDLVRAVQIFNGVTMEAEVDEAVEQFPGDEERSTDQGTLSEAES